MARLTAPGVPDGIYQVNSQNICAGFVVQDGRVVQCAPILLRRLDYWVRVAERTGDVPPLAQDGDAQ